MVSALNRQPRGGSSRGKRLWEPVLLPLPCRLPGRKAPPQAAGHAPTKPSSDRCEQVVPLARAGGCFTAPGGDPAPGPPAIVAAIGSLRRSAFESRAMGRVCAALPPLLPPRLPPPHVQPPPPNPGSIHCLCSILFLEGCSFRCPCCSGMDRLSFSMGSGSVGVRWPTQLPRRPGPHLGADPPPWVCCPARSTPAIDSVHQPTSADHVAGRAHQCSPRPVGVALALCQVPQELRPL